MTLRISNDASDPFRVEASASPIANDLDPLVLFSSKYPAAHVDYYTAYVGGGAGGTFYFSRARGYVPTVMGVVYTGAEVIVPYRYMQIGVSASNGAVSLQIDERFTLESTTSYCNWYTSVGGWLRLWAFG